MSHQSLRSMTAFARVERQFSACTLIWEVKSVNHRYLEVGTRLPDAFRDLDVAVRERCRNRLARGKIECSLRYQTTVSGEDIALNETLVSQLGDAARRAAELLGQEQAGLDLSDLLRFPGVLQGAEVDLATFKAPAMELLDAALDALVEHREREGSALGALVEERLDGVLEQVAITRAALPEILAALRERLQARVAEVVESPDPQRLEQELVLLAQRMDVAEEMDRLEAHVAEVRHTLRKGGPCGRRLDFLMQELNREANTLGSKSVDRTTTQASVELKVLIEQMREQIQNLE